MTLRNAIRLVWVLALCLWYWEELCSEEYEL